MTTVHEHYSSHLAPIYIWMAGGVSAAINVGESDLLGLVPGLGLAVDLGAGFGMHSIPLARAGYQVLAIDSSELLLAELSRLAESLPIDVKCADLLSFPALLPCEFKPRLIVCMGDTLTHLESVESVCLLAQSVAESLEPGGRFVATFRDYTKPPSGDSRFIPVRADDDRILTCFLEEHPNHIQVHDILLERLEGKWATKVSSYPKLKLRPEVACEAFESAGLRARLEPGPRGMQRLVADA